MHKYEFCDDIDVCLQELESNDEVAVAVSLERALNNRLLHRDKMFCFPEAENIKTQPISLILRKDYPFIGELNKLIRRATEGGLFVKRKNDNRLKYERTMLLEHSL